LEDICTVPINHDTNLDSIRAPRHDFLRTRPLVAITYFKCNGMAVLGPGLLMQQAAYGALIKEVKRTIRDISTVATANGSQDHNIINAAKSFRCVLLDPQGWADLVSIMFCSDYSVIATVLARIRCLTHQDLYAQWEKISDQTVPEPIKLFHLHPEMARAFRESAKEYWHQDWNPSESFKDNHVFCSTFTTLGISHEAFEKTEMYKRPSDYSGDVIADTRFVCSAGHCTKVKEIASKLRYKAPLKSKPEHMWYVIGHNDFIYQQMLDDRYDSDSVVEVSGLVQQIKGMRDCLNQDSVDPLSFLRLHALEMSSDLRIPLIKGVKLSYPRLGHVETRLVLDRIKAWLLDEDHEKGFSIKRLQNALTEIQLPEPLSKSVVFLFLDYVNCLSDVFLFDHVIDLHDVFSAVYGLIARRLPELMKRNVKSSYDARTFLDVADLDHTVELIDLLRNALSSRVQVAFREAERWGITLDIRGSSFNRLLNAADVPLKCGLGLLWRVVRGDTDLYKDVNDNKGIKRQIGGASRITYDSRSYSHRLDIGYNHDFFITSVDLNLTHLTRPRNLLVHLHETAHLVCHFLRDKVKCTHPEYSCNWYGLYCHKCPTPNPINRIASHLRDRFEDVFSEMLVHKFVFGNDYKTYLRNYVASCATESVASINDPEEAFCHIVELLLRGFLVTDPFRRPGLYANAGGQAEMSEITEEGFRQFSEAIADVSSFIFDYDDILKDPPRKRLHSYFNKVFKESYHPICCIWEDVQTIYRGICDGNEKKGVFGLDPAPQDKENLISQIKDGLSEGRPLVRIQYEDPRTGRESEEYTRLDALFLVRHLLKLHIANLFADVNTKDYTCCLIRGVDGRLNPEGAQEGKKWNRQLLDRVYNGLVAADPGIRSRYMLERIVIIKSLWDISTNFRARRLLDLLTTVWQ